MHTARTVALSMLALAGSTALARADGEMVAVLTKNQTNPYFHALRLGAEQAARSMGARVVQYVPTKPDSIPEQLSQIEDVLVKKPDAIVFVPVDYKAMIPGLEKMNTAQVPVINATDRMAGGIVASFVGSNDYGLGMATAHSLLKAMGGKGNLVIIEGVKGYITNVDRTRAFRDALKEYPEVKLLASQTGNFQRLNALQVMENLLQSFPKIDGVLAANDAMAVGVIEALDGADRKARVAGVNGTQEAIDAVKAGKLVASGAADPFAQGCAAGMLAVRAARKQPVPAEMLWKPFVIDKENVAEFDIPPDKRTCTAYEAIVK